MPVDNKINVEGFEFNKKFDFDEFIRCFGSTGFQATHLHKAIEITKMMKCKREEIINVDESYKNDYNSKNNCTIFLGYTSNMVSSGNREIIRYLVEHSYVDALVTTCGGIEEDFIKCLAPTYLGNFRMDDSKLREDQLNRIGNLIIPSENYTLFENWVNPIFEEMIEMQNSGTKWTPSRLIRLLGEKINNEKSIYYWAFKNNIPVFCPAITDGALGDMLYFYSIKAPGLSIDVIDDLTKINNLAKFSFNTGMIILGGGLVKHHICNANLMRNGADFSVFINTAVEYDGSDAGAEPTEAVSWGKIKSGAKAVKVFCDATIAFPILVAAVFKN